jgi:hypothetical protein
MSIYKFTKFCFRIIRQKCQLFLEMKQDNLTIGCVHLVFTRERFLAKKRAHLNLSVRHKLMNIK